MNQRAVRSLVPVRLLGALMGAVALMLAIVTPSHAQDRRPLLMEGKTELFQRVLTRPGASIAPAIGADGVDPVQPFTPFYVYQRHPVDGGGTPWLEVGLDAKGAVSGYLKASETVAWDHALVMAFTERVNRQRALFFDQDADLKSWLTAPDLLIKADQARRAIDGNALPADSPVVSIEPRQVVDFESNFYMLPVLQAQTVLLPSRKRVRIVEVASVTVAEDPVSRAEASEQKPVGPPVVVNRRMTPDQIEQGLADFRAGVVFVIDASSSMGPYIAQTRAVMDRVLSRVEQAGLADKVRFGLVAYRDDPATVSGIDYLTKTFADPNTVRGAGDFAQAIQPLEASNVSTRAFAEDAFAAVNTAFREIDWSDFGARYVILVTDASARTARAEQVNGKIVPASDTGLDVAAMHKIVRANKAALYTLHLKTPVGKADHDRAQRQYRQLSAYDGLEPLYYPVASGDPNAFAARVESLAEALVAQISTARQAVLDAQADPTPDPAPDPSGSAAAPSPAAPSPAAPGVPSAPGLDSAAETDPLIESARLIGRAMALAHLGRQQGVAAPPMFRAWASTRDFQRPTVEALSVRVLLSRNQISDLQKTLQLTVDALEAGQIEPDDLFNQLRSAALAAGRDPDKTGQGRARNMADTGLIGEYLDGLPYQSRLMSLSEDDWIAMTVGEQQRIIDETYANIRLYQALHDDSARWIALHPEADPGDYVYPVPLDALP